MSENKELDDWIKFLRASPTFGQFNAVVNGKNVTAELLYALWVTRNA